MTISRTIAVPLASYPNQSRPLPETAIPDWVSEFRWEMLRCTTADATIWPLATTTLKADFEVSYDGGVTWEYGGGFASGGGIVSFGGQEIATNVARWLLRPDTVNRKVRGSLVITGGPLRSQGTLVLADAAG